MNNLRIVFMGTPDFAVATLGSLLMNGFNVVGVVTAPDKPSGRGRKMTKSAVKEYAENTLPVFQPETLKDPAFIQNLKELNADIFIVVAFRMLPEAVWRMPRLGTINLHASLLPYYRGAAPINHAIINGEVMTGITTFFIDDKIDTGNILFREELQIFAFENAGDLHDRLMKEGARLVIRTINAIAENNFKTHLQSEFIIPGKKPKDAPKIHPDTCIVNWNNEAMNIHNLVRGLAPYPCAKSFLTAGDEKLSFKIFESEPHCSVHNFVPGALFSDGKHYLKFSCKDGFVNILSLQLEGKKRMNTVEFLRGFNIINYTTSII